MNKNNAANLLTIKLLFVLTGIKHFSLKLKSTRIIALYFIKNKVILPEKILLDDH